MPAGVIGARLYHVATDWERFSGHLFDIVKIWQGGLGIPGGMALGIIVGIWQAHRRGLALGPTITAATPSLPLAQAIGRWGNWFNQELFGRATTLPWALRVSDDKAVAAGYPPGTTFHPTFLYESLWNLALCGLLLWIDRRFRLRPGRLLAVYTLGYGIGRYWVEGLRIDAGQGGRRPAPQPVDGAGADHRVRRLPPRRLGPPPQRPTRRAPRERRGRRARRLTPTRSRASKTTRHRARSMTPRPTTSCRATTTTTRAPTTADEDAEMPTTVPMERPTRWSLPKESTTSTRSAMPTRPHRRSRRRPLA